MLWAQITFLTMQFLTLLVCAHERGKLRVGKEKFWPALIGVSMNVILIYFAGGFSHIHFR
jgi:hypothetical protein